MNLCPIHRPLSTDGTNDTAATSSYISLSHPSLFNWRFHWRSPSSRSINGWFWHFLFVPENKLETVDKTRVARVRNNLSALAHFNLTSYFTRRDADLIQSRYSPKATHLYRSCTSSCSICLTTQNTSQRNELDRMYTVHRKTGQLTLCSEAQSSRKGDGPQHVIVSPDAKFLYSVTKHSTSNLFLDCLFT